MREILFRGKRKDNGEWVEGYYVHQYGADMIYIPCTEETKDGLDYYHINAETVGQFTGLYDKNGTKIFEGDIVYCISNTDYGNCVVIFEEGEFRLVSDRYYKTYTTGGGYHAIRCFIKKVIGNIHDNPELLEGETE